MSNHGETTHINVHSNGPVVFGSVEFIGDERLQPGFRHLGSAWLE
jgi:hypothetical protein